MSEALSRGGGLFMSLINLSVKDFLKELASSSPAPGGGSSAALVGAMGSALASMVSNLTLGKKGYESVQDDVKVLLERARTLMEKLLMKVDEDSEAFNSFMSALKLPKGSGEREKALDEALRRATLLPLSVMELSLEVLKLAEELLEKGNKNALSDTAVSAVLAYGAMESAYFNVLINCLSIKDLVFKEASISKAKGYLETGKLIYERLRNEVKGRLER